VFIAVSFKEIGTVLETAFLHGKSIGSIDAIIRIDGFITYRFYVRDLKTMKALPCSLKNLKLSLL